MSVRTQNKTFARNRRGLDPTVPARSTPAVITNMEATAAETIRLTFNGRVTPSKKPMYKAGTDGAETVESMNAISDTVIELTFTGSVQGTDLIVQGGDPGIRTTPGGFVPAGTYAIPTFP